MKRIQAESVFPGPALRLILAESRCDESDSGGDRTDGPMQCPSSLLVYARAVNSPPDAAPDRAGSLRGTGSSKDRWATQYPTPVPVAPPPDDRQTAVVAAAAMAAAAANSEYCWTGIMLPRSQSSGLFQHCHRIIKPDLFRLLP